MIESVIIMLIYLCLLAICVYLIIWVLGVIGITIPDNVMKLLWVIVVLIAILMIVRTILPGMGLRVGKLSWGVIQDAMLITKVVLLA